MVGYSDYGLGYRLYLPKTREVIKTKDVVFVRDKPAPQTSENSNELEAIEAPAELFARTAPDQHIEVDPAPETAEPETVVPPKTGRRRRKRGMRFTRKKKSKNQKASGSPQVQLTNVISGPSTSGGCDQGNPTHESSNPEDKHLASASQTALIMNPTTDGSTTSACGPAEAHVSSAHKKRDQVEGCEPAAVPALEPATYDEAVSCVDRKNWLEAISQELQKMKELKV